MQSILAKCSQDWPLSREEKKTQLLRLYNDDVKAADYMVESGNKALEALREELDAVRRAAGVQQSASKALDAGVVAPCTPEKAAKAEVERLRQAVESAAAVLRAIVPAEDDGASDLEATPTRNRSKSEGASRETGAVFVRSALSRTPRRPKRKVSFGRQPEEEPANDPEIGTLDGDDTSVVLQTPPSKFGALKGSGSEASAEATKHFEDDQTVTDSKRNLGGKATRLVLGLGLLALVGFCAHRMGSSRQPEPASVAAGDPTCWSEGFNPAFCCGSGFGNKGNHICWDGEYTFDRCCLGKKKNKEL